MCIGKKARAKDNCLVNSVISLLSDNKIDHDIMALYDDFCESKYDIIISLGGDGTLLSSSHKIQSTPILGINLGNVGFLTALEIHQLELLNDILKGKYIISERMRLHINLLGQNFSALNDIVISVTKIARMAKFTIYIDNKRAVEYNSDGIIVSTPTGSTAYSLSAGGSVLDDNMDAVIITPICPYQTLARGIVVSGDSKITIRTDSTTNITLTIDGQISKSIISSDINIKKSENSLKLIKSHDYCFFDTLRQKMRC